MGFLTCSSPWQLVEALALEGLEFGGLWGSLDFQVLYWGSLGDQGSDMGSLPGVMGIPGHLGPFYGHGVGVMRVPVCRVPYRGPARGFGICVWFWWSLGGPLGSS